METEDDIENEEKRVTKEELEEHLEKYGPDGIMVEHKGFPPQNIEWSL